jgi:hypothetical protein
MRKGFGPQGDFGDIAIDAAKTESGPDVWRQ